MSALQGRALEMSEVGGVTSSGGWRTTAALISSAPRCEIALIAPQEEGNDTNFTHAQEPAASHDRYLLDWPAARDSMLKNTKEHP
jgi:hypothetical protein